MDYACGDNRFEIIERYKNELISATNIESSSDEMTVLDNILFRFWQMGWLKEHDAVTPKYIDGKRNHFIKCGKCNTDLMRGMKYCPYCGQAVKWE